MKIVRNGQHGGFSLSRKACELLKERNPEKFAELDPEYGYLHHCDVGRSDEDVISVVEELQTEADGRHATLCIVDFPDGVPHVIDEYDGWESVLVDWKALCVEFVGASELDEETARERMIKALEWSENR